MLAESRTIFSADRRYRYTLWRDWENGVLFTPKSIVRAWTYAMFIGLNPSTADEMNDDPTIRRCIGFAKRWGYGALMMTNLFAFRATDPQVMMEESKPIGDENDRWLLATAREAGVVVAAWGVKGQFMGRDKEVMKLLSNLECLGVTAGGFPQHPLYFPYGENLKPYPRLSASAPA